MRLRVSDASIEELLDNGGQLRTGPVNAMDVYRLAADLKDAREDIKRLRATHPIGTGESA